MNRLIGPLVLTALLAAGCAAEKSENPLSPTVAGPIPGVEITAPRTLEPGGGQLIPVDRQPVTLLLENASSNGPRPLTYSFEVATDAAFTSRVFSRDAIAPGDGGRTALRLPDALGSGRSYYWRAKAEDGANTGPFSSPATFNVFTPVVIDVPTPLAPVNNIVVADLTPEFRLRNAARSGPATAITYTLELAENDAFSNKFAVWQFDERQNETKFTAAAALLPGRQYFWHVRAADDSTLGNWSATHVFRTPVPIDPVPPPLPGGNCSSSTTHLGVVQCRRSQWGHMSPSQLNEFLRAVARDLNTGNFAGAPFGILPKTTGNQCLGYSCDIICSNNSYWDVLLDSDDTQVPIWGFRGANTSTCVIQR